MKKIILNLVYFFASMVTIQAQSLFGLTGGGGADGGGTIIKFLPATNNLTVAKSFESRAVNPQSGLIQASNGKLYGTSGGGSSSNGVIFSYDPSTATFAKIKNFNGTDGTGPTGSLVQASNGKLYGMTNSGGSSNYGVIFSFDPSSSTYTKLMDFIGANGINPTGGLVQVSNGKLYGMTNSGGSNNYGVIFSFDPSSSTYSKLMDFGGSNGARPNGSLILATDGKLYGMTSIGGKYMYYNNYNNGHGHGYYRSYQSNNDGYGVIFSFNPKGSAYKKLLDFDLTNGANPNGSLTQASNGKLYGMTTNGGSRGYGVTFSYNLSSTPNYTKLYDFSGMDGANPMGSLMQASNGKLYGMTYNGGSGYGVMFSFDPSSSSYIKLKNFEGDDGANPTGSLVQTSNGKLYGTASGGGNGNAGVIFSFDPSVSIYTKQVDIGYTIATSPSGRLVQANNGKLYGMTDGGGSGNSGVIFSFDPTSLIYAKLVDFDGANGNNDYGSSGLIRASDGKLYGTTSQGGSSGYGVMFSFDPSTSMYTKLVDFVGENGQQPSGSLIQASNGKLYGVTSGGGNSNAGVIFSFDPSTSIYNYTSLDGDSGFLNGVRPYGGLVQANSGKLYGTTVGGGNINRGVIFSFDPSTSTYTKLKDFGYNDYTLTGNFIQASNGKLYGMMSGGSSTGGAIVSFDPSTLIYTKLKYFAYPNNDINGSNPSGSLMQASDGKLYGMTFTGGAYSNNYAYGYGIIFSFDPSTSTFTKLQDFKGTNGAWPSHAAFIELNETLHVTSVNLSGKNSYSTAEKNNYNKQDVVGLTVAPNPVINSTSISFTIQQPQHASLRIFDANGKMIKILADKVFENGQYTFQWNAADVSAGIYYFHFVAGAFSETKKLVVIH